jgi:hypothetical protein
MKAKTIKKQESTPLGITSSVTITARTVPLNVMKGYQGTESEKSNPSLWEKYADAMVSESPFPMKIGYPDNPKKGDLAIFIRLIKFRVKLPSPFLIIPVNSVSEGKLIYQVLYHFDEYCRAVHTNKKLFDLGHQKVELRKYDPDYQLYNGWNHWEDREGFSIGDALSNDLYRIEHKNKTPPK